MHVLAVPALVIHLITATADRPAIHDTTQAQAPPQSWSLVGDFSITAVGGNTSLSLLSGRLSLNRSGGAGAALSTSVSARYGRSDGDVAVADYGIAGEARFAPRRTVSPFVTLTGNRDDVRNVELRLAASAGADLNLVQDSVGHLSLGLALLQDYEEVALPPGSVQPEHTSLTRVNVRVSGLLPIRPGVSLTQQSTLQPVADDPGDYLLTSETAMQVMLSSRLAFRTSFVFNRDTTPPEGVAFRDDRTLTAGLMVELR